MQKRYEIYGDTQKVVFLEGVVVLGKNLFIYREVDRIICLATCDLDRLFRALA